MPFNLSLSLSLYQFSFSQLTTDIHINQIRQEIIVFSLLLLLFWENLKNPIWNIIDFRFGRVEGKVCVIHFLLQCKRESFYFYETSILSPLSLI